MLSECPALYCEIVGFTFEITPVKMVSTFYRLRSSTAIFPLLILFTLWIMCAAMDLGTADCGGDFMAFTGQRLAADRVSCSWKMKPGNN
jgi:hypothetical protein